MLFHYASQGLPRRQRDRDKLKKNPSSRRLRAFLRDRQRNRTHLLGRLCHGVHFVENYYFMAAGRQVPLLSRKGLNFVANDVNRSADKRPPASPVLRERVAAPSTSAACKGQSLAFRPMR